MSSTSSEWVPPSKIEELYGMTAGLSLLISFKILCYVVLSFKETSSLTSTLPPPDLGKKKNYPVVLPLFSYIRWVRSDVIIHMPINHFHVAATPNGIKVGIMLEELGIDYDAHGKFFWYS